MIVHSPPSRFSRLLPAMSGHAADGLSGALGVRLDDEYHYFRHVSPGGGGRLDAVVVGPGGTWTLSRAGERGRFRKRNGHWYRWSRSTESWIPWDAAPIIETRMAGHRLELYLDRAGLPAAVEACLLTARGMEVGWDAGQRPGIHVHPDGEIDRLARRIARDEILTHAQVDRIVALLDPREPLRRLAPSTPQG